MTCPHCSHPIAHKHGRHKGYQRWKCANCKRTFSDDPNPTKAGRKPLGDRKMTEAEKKRRQRRLKKQMEDPNSNGV